jgi:transcriptional regulator with XRE-family HTH domain
MSATPDQDSAACCRGLVQLCNKLLPNCRGTRSRCCWTGSATKRNATGTPSRQWQWTPLHSTPISDGVVHGVPVSLAIHQGIAYDTSVKFAKVLLDARTAAGLTQAELEARSGVARPNIAAFEAGRREPRWETATRTLEATGATIDIVEPITWTWTTGRRPYAVPSRLWRLPLGAAFRTFTPGPHLWWSGATPSFDLADRDDRARAYELVLREGQPDDIQSIVDGALLIDAWPDLVVTAELRHAWQPIIDGTRTKLAKAS